MLKVIHSSFVIEFESVAKTLAIKLENVTRVDINLLLPQSKDDEQNSSISSGFIMPFSNKSREIE